MIADPNNLLGSIQAVVVVWGTGWIVNDHRWSTTLDYVYRDVVSPRKCHDLWLPTPDAGIANGGAVHLELLWGHETSIGGTDPIFAIYRGQERNEIVGMGIDVIRCGCACDDVVCLRSGEYSQNRELVCDRGKQTMPVWCDLETDSYQIILPRRGKANGHYKARDREICRSC